MSTENGISLAQAYQRRTGLLDWFVPTCITVFLLAVSHYNFLLFHTLAELFAIVVAFMLGVVSWHTYTFNRNDFMMYLGCGYIWIGLLDLAHVFVFKGMNLFPGIKTELSVQFWIATRYLEALLLFSAPYFLVHRVNRYYLTALFGLIAVSVSALIITGNFPVTFIEGQGLTAFKIYSEYIVVLILALAIAYLWSQRALLDTQILRYLIAAIVMTMLVELTLTLYITIDATPMIIGHILKFFSFWMVYLAIVRTMLRDPFRTISRSASTYDAIPDATIVVDSNGIIQQANHAASMMAGHPKHELIGRNSHDFFHTGIADNNECPICKNHGVDDRITTMECRAARTGSWYDFTLAPYHGPAEQESQVITIRDITRRKQTEMALRESEQLIRSSEQRFQDLVRNIPGIVFRYVIAGDGTASFPYVSPKVQEILKLSPVDIMHDSSLVLKMIDERDRAAFATSLSDSQRQMIPWQWEGRVTKENQNLGWFRIAALPRRQDNGSILWNGLMTDITDMKLAEQELSLHREHLEELVAERTRELAIARDEALQAARVKNTFLDNMSYELRTPLNSIIGFTSLIRDGQAGAVNKEQKLQLDMIHDSASSLLGLINDILEIASIEKRSAVTTRERFDFQPLLESITTPARIDAEGKGLKLSVESSSDSQMIYSDQAKLRQIVQHLLDNAIKFTDKGTITVRSILNDQELVIEIIDTGIGIPAEQISRMFEIFSARNDDAEDHRQGAGLGLSICKHFTELLGGELDVHSTPDQGTIVTVRLPVHEEATIRPVAGPTEQPVQISTGFTILAVDSDPEFLELMQAYLQESFEVITCRNANDAVFMAKRFNPAIITIDILMPYVDGWTILTELKTDEATRDIPVIVISTYDDKGKSQMLGATAILKKPLSRDKLLNTLYTVTEQQHQERRSS